MRRLAIAALVLFSPLAASGDESRVVSRTRIKVSDIARAPDDVGAVDIGAAPPPGGSRVFARIEIEDRVRSAGLDPRVLKLPPTVRVVSASRRLTPEILAKLATPAVERALPQGVTLTKIEPAYEVVTLPGSTIRAATIPRLPHQKGIVRSTATLELAGEDEGVTKIPVSITLEVSEAAARADVPRGGRLEVVIERRAVRIATTAVATADADIGDTTNVSLVATGRVVRARILTKERAEILDRP